MPEQTSRLENTASTFATHRIGILGKRVIDFWSVLAFQRPEVVVLCESGDDVLKIAPLARLLSLESEDPRRKPWNNRSLAELAALARADLGNLSVSPSHPLMLLAYCGTPEWEELERETRGAIRVVASPPALKARIDDKIYTRAGLAARGLPVPRSTVIADASTMDFDALAATLGNRLIVQQPVGAAGIGTYGAASATDLKRIAGLAPRGRMLVSSHVGNTTLNVHGLAMPAGVQVAQPSVQLTGVPELVGTPYGYCGNDFGAVKRLPARVVERTRELTRAVGSWLLGEGFLGMFGIDVAVEGDAVTILEVNPRLQGSTWLLAMLEAGNGAVPLVVKHFAHLLGSRVDAGEPPAGMPGAQAILYSLADGDVNVSHSLESAVYELDAHDGLHFRRPMSWPTVLRDREVLVFGLPAREGMVVDPGGVLARFACAELLAHSDGRTLTDFGRSVVRALEREVRTTRR